MKELHVAIYQHKVDMDKGNKRKINQACEADISRVSPSYFASFSSGKGPLCSKHHLPSQT